MADNRDASPTDPPTAAVANLQLQGAGDSDDDVPATSTGVPAASVQPPQPPATPQAKHRNVTSIIESGTPMVRKTSSTLNSKHTVEHVKPSLRTDLDKHQKSISMDTWLAVILGLPSANLQLWTSEILGNAWHADSQIAAAMDKFCKVKSEIDRYVPFSKICNRILKLAPGQLTGVSEPLPVPDITFTRNDPIYLENAPEQGELAADRKPDVAVTTGDLEHTLKKSRGSKGTAPGLPWTGLLAWVEFKASVLNLSRKLANARENRPTKQVKSKRVSSSCTLFSMVEQVLILLPTCSRYAVIRARVRHLLKHWSAAEEAAPVLSQDLAAVATPMGPFR